MSEKNLWPRSLMQLAALVAKWRTTAQELRCSPAALVSALRIEDCADELEAALAAMGPSMGDRNLEPHLLRSLIAAIDARFESGNEISVERVHIKAHEWALISSYLFIAIKKAEASEPPRRRNRNLKKDK